MACGSLRKRDGHSSGTPVARRILQPTRMTDLDRSSARKPQRHPYSVLLPVRFAVPPSLLTSAVVSYSTVSPLPCGQYATRPKAVCFLWHCLWDRGGEASIPPDVIRHRSSMEPGLSSPAAFRHWRGAAVRPTDNKRNGDCARWRQGARPKAVKQKKPGLVEGMTSPGGCLGRQVKRADRRGGGALAQQSRGRFNPSRKSDRRA